MEWSIFTKKLEVKLSNSQDIFFGKVEDLSVSNMIAEDSLNAALKLSNLELISSYIAF